MKSFFILVISLLSISKLFSQSRGELELIMDAWARESFDSCFKGRTYKSISVSSFSVEDKSRSIYIQGDVSYLNLLDINVRWKYNAVLTFYSPQRIKVKFNKYDGFTDTWGVCERIYNE